MYLPHLVSEMVEFCGWLPLLALTCCCGTVQQAVHQCSRSGLLHHLRVCGLNLPPATDLPFGILTRLLHTMLVAQIVRYDQPTAIGPWWAGTLFPQTEARVAARYRRQQPRRPWPQGGVLGAPLSAADLGNVFPPRVFGLALDVLRQHGGQFRVHRVVHRFVNEAGGHLEGTRVEVVTLSSTVRGFEVYLRWTQARLFNVSDSGSASPASDGT